MKYFLSSLLIASSFTASNGFAVECKTTVIAGKGNPMSFDRKEIVVPPSCKEFEILLENKSTLPKAAMGHNLVITKESLKQEFATAAMGVGLGGEYIPKGKQFSVDGDNVLGYTKLLGPNEKDSVKFKTEPLKNGKYKFFCSFAGHASVMVGDLKIGTAKVN